MNKIIFTTMNLHEKIKESLWWQRAMQFPDRHYKAISGVMLTDHLLAVHDNICRIFEQKNNSFLSDIFNTMHLLHVSPKQMFKELSIVALLHDIGKTEDDKLLYMIHPLNKQLVLKRHSVVGVKAAMDILDDDETLTAEEKTRIYWTIEQHDISYGLFRQYKSSGEIPGFETWRILNDNIDARSGAGLLYLLIFKLADVHGHADIEDVLWFYETVCNQYFEQLGIQLPIPREEDIR